MLHKALKADFCENTILEVTFHDGKVMRFDMALLFEEYPQLRALEDRKLFRKGRLLGHSGIVWNDELDIETETIYREGTLVRRMAPFPGVIAGDAVAAARARAGISQKTLSEATGIDQSDISRIERGIANPSVSTLNRIAAALDAELHISIK